MRIKYFSLAVFLLLAPVCYAGVTEEQILKGDELKEWSPVLIGKFVTTGAWIRGAEHPEMQRVTLAIGRFLEDHLLWALRENQIKSVFLEGAHEQGIIVRGKFRVIDSGVGPAEGHEVAHGGRANLVVAVEVLAAKHKHPLIAQFTLTQTATVATDPHDILMTMQGAARAAGINIALWVARQRGM